jgi:ribosome-associated protein
MLLYLDQQKFSDFPEVEKMDVLPPSKSQRKREMHGVQALGEALVTLSVAKLKTLDLPERLFDAIVAAQTITRHEARRRQMQFIGRLMRDVDPAPIQALLAAQAAVPASEKARMVLLEGWRQRLLEEPAASLEALAAEFPGAFSEEESEAWRQRIEKAQRERRQAQATPRHYRLLFQDLKKLFDGCVDDAADISEQNSP